jgi:hypothetical protein
MSEPGSEQGSDRVGSISNAGGLLEVIGFVEFFYRMLPAVFSLLHGF